MESELLGSFDDDVVAGGVPAYHVVVFGFFEEPERRASKKRNERDLLPLAPPTEATMNTNTKTRARAREQENRLDWSREE